MAVHIRLARAGSKKRPFYRLVAADHRSPRDGQFLEKLGTYDPFRGTRFYQLNRERLEYWQKVGARCTKVVSALLKYKPEFEKTAQIKVQQEESKPKKRSL